MTSQVYWHLNLQAFGAQLLNQVNMVTPEMLRRPSFTCNVFHNSTESHGIRKDFLNGNFVKIRKCIHGRELIQVEIADYQTVRQSTVV